MTTLYLWNNGPRAHVLLCRPIVRAAVSTGRFDVVFGACRDDVRLLLDLEGPRCRIVASDYANTVHGAVLDLAALTPTGAIGIDVWLGGPGPAPSLQWEDVLAAFRASLADHGLDSALPCSPDDVPMLDFAFDERALGPTPRLRRPSILLDTCRDAADASWFGFDFDRLSRVLDAFDLLCTAPPPIQRDNLVDVSALSPLARARLSEHCELLIGRTFDPFVLTLTEPNRFKPKALCGYDARVTRPPWDYPGNPLELIATMDDLVDFAIAQVGAGALR